MDTPRVLTQPARPFVGSFLRLLTKTRCLVLGLALVPVLKATDREWNHPTPTSTQWNNPSNWTPSGGYPGSGDTATFGANTNGGTIDLGTSLTIGDIHITSAAGSGALIFGSGATNSQTITFSNSGTILHIDSGNNTQVNFSAAVNLFRAGTLIIDHDGSGPLTFYGDVGGVGSLNLQGTGTTIFRGDITYNGTTSVSNGTVYLGNGSSSGTMAGGLALNSSGTFVFNRSGTYTYSQAISGSGSLEKNSSGTIVLTGNSSGFSGSTVIKNGTLQIGDGGTTGSLGGDVQVNGSRTFSINRSDSLTLTQTLSGTGNITQVGSGTTIFTGDSSAFTGATTISAGTLQIGNGGTTGALGGNVSIGASGTFAFNRSDSIAYSDVISGSGTLSQIGSGTTVLTGNSGSFSGSTVIDAGTLQIGDGGTSGALGGNVLVNASGTFSANRSNSLTLSQAFSGTGNITQVGSGTTILTGDSSAFAGTTTIGAGTLQLGNGGSTGDLGGTIDIDGGTLAINRSSGSFDAAGVTFSSGILSSTIELSNLAAITSGVTVDLTPGGSITGGVTISGGELSVGDFDAGSLIFNGAGTLRASGEVTNYTNINGAGRTVILEDGASMEVTGRMDDLITVNSGATFIITRSGQANGFPGTLSGDGSFIKRGGGQMNFTTDQPFSGQTTIEAGTIQLGNGTSNGNFGGDIEVQASGTLRFLSNTDGITFEGALTGSGNIQQNSNATIILSGDSSAFTGTTTVNNGSLEIAAGASLGGIVDVGDNVVRVTGSGANLSLSTGASTLDNGRIEVANGATAQTTGSGTLSFHATNGGEIALDNGSLNVSSMSSALDLGAAGLISGNGTVTGDIDLGSAGSITGDVTGIDLYGTLSGSGSLANVSIFGTLAPGASPGTINVTGDLTLTLNSTTIMELAGSGGVAGTDYDTINASGILTFNGALEIANYGGYEPAAGQSYTLFSASSFAGDFTSVTVGSIGLTAIEGQDQWSGQVSSLAYFFNADSGVLSVSAVPEPSTVAALAGAIALGFALRRRRAKSFGESTG